MKASSVSVPHTAPHLCHPQHMVHLKLEPHKIHITVSLQFHTSQNRAVDVAGADGMTGNKRPFEDTLAGRMKR